MQAEVTLTVTYGQEHKREVKLESPRFTIGRSPDNDLVINDSGMSRRHALIETYDGIVQISDCGSQNGTFVNGRPILGAQVLNDGDVISLGSSCQIIVRRATTSAQLVEAAAPLSGLSRQLRGLTTPVIAAAAIAVILLLTLVLILVLKDDHSRANGAKKSGDPALADARPQSAGSERSSVITGTEAEASSQSSFPSVSLDQIERLAGQVIRRISSDDKPYLFPPQVVGEIEQKVKHYSASPNLAEALRALALAEAEIARLARHEGLEPDLVSYLALAETWSGATGRDLTHVARRMLPDLLSLRATFESTSADGSLLIVAAYKMGPGTKRSHPLLTTMRRVVENPLTQRNVWYLHERRAIETAVYDFVISFLALGVIAQNPRQFGVSLAPA